MTSLNIVQARQDATSFLLQSEQHTIAGRPAQDRNCKALSKQELSNLSIYSIPSFLENSNILPPDSPLDAYSILKLEPLQTLHLGIPRVIKICTSNCLLSEKHRKPVNATSRTVKSVRSSIPQTCNNILAAIERDYCASGLHVDFSTSETGSHLNEIFTEDGLRGMLEAKDVRALDMVFPFIGAHIDGCCSEALSAPITSVKV